jgi:hypothetical protein
VTESTGEGPDPAKIRAALERILAADDEGDGHEFIHAMRDAKKLLGLSLRSGAADE